MAMLLAAMFAGGCGTSASDDGSSDDGASSALTVDQVRPPTSRTWLTHVPALHAAQTGAATWSLYSARGTNVGPKKKSFDGIIAYGADANGQATWELAIDAATPGSGLAVFISPDSGDEQRPANFPPELQRALQDELRNLHDALRASPPSAADASGADAPLGPTEVDRLLSNVELTTGTNWTSVEIGLGFFTVVGILSYLFAF